MTTRREFMGVSLVGLSAPELFKLLHQGAAKAAEKTRGKAVEVTLRSGKNGEATEAVRQGDIYIEKVPVPYNWSKWIRTSETQLAAGTSAGSRHCVHPDSVRFCDIRLRPMAKRDVLYGPVIHAKEGGLEIDHPEHGNIRFTEPGFYQISYQRLFSTDGRKRIYD